MSDRTETKTIDRMTRRPSSANGNPRWRLFFTDGTSADTMTDSGWAYEANNAENIGAPLAVTFTARGTVRYARRIGGES